MTGSERGWALISVLWVLSILTMLIAAAQALSFSAAQREQRALRDAESGAMLDAAIVRAVLGIEDPRPQLRWRVDGVPQTFAFRGQTIRVTIQDEFGRIDLNAADGSLINQLLRSAGVEKQAAEALTDNILDWRSSSQEFRRWHGATNDDYAKAGLATRPRHNAFQSVDELRLVYGMTPALFASIRPAVTVYSRHPAIDTNTAPREALLAYYPNQRERVDELLKTRATSAERGGGNVGTLSDGFAGRTFDVTVAWTADRRAQRREAIVMLTNAPERPFLTMALY